MEATIREISSIRRELDITLSQADIKPYFDQVYRKAQQNIQLKGFRKGKVPISMIKRMYGASINEDAIESAVKGEFEKYARDEDLHILGDAQIISVERTPDDGVTFTASYELMPEIQLGEYKGLNVTRIYHIVSEDEINREIDRLLEAHITTEPAESVDNENFVVTIDLQRVEDDELVPDAISEGVEIYLRRQSVNSELKALLLNTRIGDTFRVDLPTGEDESMTTYQATVREINAAILPELTDEFAIKLTGEENSTQQDLIDIIKENIQAEYHRRYSNSFRDELISRLLESHQFEIPEMMVRYTLNAFVEDMKQGAKKELPQGFDTAKFEKEMRPVAERTARWMLLRDLIVEREELEADDVDYEGLANIESQRTGLDMNILLQYFKSAPATRNRIVAEKAVQLLEDYAIINEVEDLELAAQQPADK